MKHVLQLPKPHSTIQRALMDAFKVEGLVELWMPCGTKFGKTIGAAAGFSAGSYVSTQSLWRWVAPIYSQSKIGFNACKRMLPIGVEINKSDLTLEFPDRDTRLEFRSGKFPEDLEGEGVYGYIFDEAAKMDQQVYDSAKTTVTVTRGPIVGISTPKGKNWFFKKCIQAKEEMEWSIKKGIPPKKIFLTAPSSANPDVTEEAIEEARRSLPERLFRQYYLAEFIDDGSVFTGFRDCVRGKELDTYGSTQIWTHPDAKQRHVVIGADWAKKKDYTVFGAFDYKAEIPEMVGFMRFQDLPYTEAIRELYKFIHQFEDVAIINHDKTGLGEVIDDMLANLPVPANGIVFTNKSKSEMVNKLMMAFEKKVLSLPDWPEMVKELESYEVVTNNLGNMRYSAPEGMHDDIVSMMILAYEAISEYSHQGYEIEFLEDLPKKKVGLEKWYNKIIEDENDSPFS